MKRRAGTYRWSRTSPGWTWRAIGQRIGNGWMNTLWFRDERRCAIGYWIIVTMLLIAVAIAAMVEVE